MPSVSTSPSLALQSNNSHRCFTRLRCFPGKQVVHARLEEAVKVGEESINRCIINTLAAPGMQRNQDALRNATFLGKASQANGRFPLLSAFHIEPGEQDPQMARDWHKSSSLHMFWATFLQHRYHTRNAVTCQCNAPAFRCNKQVISCHRRPGWADRHDEW